MRKIHTLTIRLMGPESASDDENQEAVDDLEETVTSYEDEISMELPEGYYIKVGD